MHSFGFDLIAAKDKHTGAEIARFFMNSMQESNLTEKIQCITLYNASVNTTFIEEFSNLLSTKNVKFDEKNQHFRYLYATF